MRLLFKEKYDISFVMPCLNEEKTVGECIDEAFDSLSRHGLSGEVIIVDNGSTDRSRVFAEKCGAAVISEPRRGYGRAIRTGIAHSRGKVIIISDCDLTYDLSHIEKFYYPLAEGRCDVMIGDRFSGGIERGAMPLLHRRGVPFLSACGRAAFGVRVRDFHCGLRSITRKAVKKMRLTTDGMEFATEFIAESARKGLRISQCPAVLRRCRYERSSKLRTFSDGARHLIYIIKKH